MLQMAAWRIGSVPDLGPGEPGSNPGRSNFLKNVLVYLYSGYILHFTFDLDRTQFS